MTTTLRIPRGLWADLEETIIQQDRQFLTEVARSLGLPVQEVLRKILGTGAPQPVAVLSGTVDTDLCPWWTRSAHGLWRPCCRLRLNPTSACQEHMRNQHAASLESDLSALPTLQPVNYDGNIYWINEDTVYREDGTIEPSRKFKFIDHRGQRICVAYRPN